MKTLEQIREEQQQLDEKRELDEYVREAGKFLKALAVVIGISTAELTKSITKTVVKNPKSSTVAVPFIAASWIKPGVMFTAFKESFVALIGPVVAILTGKSAAASAAVASGIGIGAISVGAILVVLYGEKVGTKINKSLMKNKPEKIVKKANKKQARTFFGLATR